MAEFKAAIDFLLGLVWETPEILPWFLVLLLGTGLFLTVRLGFLQFRKLWHSVKVIAGRYDDDHDPGEVTHFQALSAALSATVGIGNIAGVALAIHWGGPGALFWMWLTAFFGMASKFTECSLAVKHRTIESDGEVAGGPMYYMRDALKGKWVRIASVFAMCAVISSFGSGNAVQANTMADTFRASFGISTWITGLVSATLVGVVIIGGIRRIAAVASAVVPFMAAIYVASGLLVLILNVGAVPDAIVTIVTSAFDPPAAVGGFAGSTFLLTMLWGVKRGLFSNEAGQGSAPIAHAAARTDEPIREGVVALMEPFIDTLVICTMTGLVIVTTGVWHEKKITTTRMTEQAAIAVVPGEPTLAAGGEYEKPDLPYEVPVTDGEVAGSLVLNESVVDSARILRSSDNGGLTPFNGILRITKDGMTALDPGGDTLESGILRMEGAHLQKGAPLTAWAFQRGLEPIFPWGNLIVTLSVFLFAISTAISWSYYGDRSAFFLFGKKAVLPYRLIFVLMHFVGAIFSLELVWAFGDLALGLMAIPNLIAIILLSGRVKKDSKDYFTRMDALDAARKGGAS
ncbi:MAG: sodium:alanine symporter family protein [Pseudomonadota bacterium]